MVPSTSDGKPVYVSYIAMQRLGDSIWTCCHRTQQSKVINKKTGREEVRAVSYQPTREVVIFAGLGMLKVSRQAQSSRLCNATNWPYTICPFTNANVQP